MPTLTARYVFPVCEPPIPGGLVTYDGDRIIAVEPAGSRTADVDLGNAAILPGFVNAHTHLDLSGARGLIPPTDPDHFTDWLKGVIAFRRARTPHEVQQDIRDGLNELMSSGTTLVGDITSGGASYEALSGNTVSENLPKAGGQRPPVGESQGDAVPPLSVVRAVLFWERIGLTTERIRAEGLAMIPWLTDFQETRTCRKGISPHAPYSIQGPSFRSLAGHYGPLTTHLAESPAEVMLIREKRGPFELFLRELGIWLPHALAPSFETIIRRTRHATNSLYIHCNYLPPDTQFLPNQSIVYCPRTHAAFGHPPHPFREFLARGVRVCLGTDSLASNPDLDILAEARFVRSRYPDFPGSQLLKMITLAGAEALGWADECGSLEPGKSADLVAIPLPDRDESDPHELFLKDDSPVCARRTMFRGRWRD